MQSERAEHVDLLVDSEDGHMPKVALSAQDICLQWTELPPGALRGMEAMLSRPSGTFRMLQVGQMFGVPLQFIEREGIFSFKAVSGGVGADMIRIDLSSAAVAGLLDALADVIEVWED